MTARIVAPVSRQLSVADVDRSIAFYRDVLGFEARSAPAAEVVSGPARIALTTTATANDSTGEPRPRGAAILFFETDDVRGMHKQVVARGGSASELERVNWIKMRMFQLQDPDGHTLWFGQSFAEPDRPKDPRRQLHQLLPMLPLSDVAAGIAHYQQALGFHINYAQADLGVMDRDDVTLLLIQRTAQYTGIGSCEAYVNDADALHAELVQRGANVQGAPVSHPWGLRDFTVIDLEGNRLVFAQTFE
ncbi:MAG TPA: VOC family protein [Gemmatimonadales bacterium]|nr:VOC family protein [Gemmatimonadales bacterium]